MLRESELCLQIHFKLPVLGNCQDPQCPLLLSCSGLLSCLDKSDSAGGVAHMAAGADSLANGFCNRFQHLVLVPDVPALSTHMVFGHGGLDHFVGDGSTCIG